MMRALKGIDRGINTATEPRRAGSIRSTEEEKKNKEVEEDGRRLPCHRCPIQPGKRSGFSVIV
jgi:hypothetical protein